MIKTLVTRGPLVKIPFELELLEKIASEKYPNDYLNPMATIQLNGCFMVIPSKQKIH